jgi:PadR family transcriptional regulator PadR
MTSQIEKWEVQLRKGCLDLAILASLWPERLYGLEILKYLKQEAGLELSASTVYPLLARLKAEGLVESEWIETDLVHPRKYYRLTETGRERAREMAAAWLRFSGSLGGLLAPLGKEKVR